MGLFGRKEPPRRDYNQDSSSSIGSDRLQDAVERNRIKQLKKEYRQGVLERRYQEDNSSVLGQNPNQSSKFGEQPIFEQNQNQGSRFGGQPAFGQSSYEQPGFGNRFGQQPNFGQRHNPNQGSSFGQRSNHPTFGQAPYHRQDFSRTPNQQSIFGQNSSFNNNFSAGVNSSLGGGRSTNFNHRPMGGQLMGNRFGSSNSTSFGASKFANPSYSTNKNFLKISIPESLKAFFAKWTYRGAWIFCLFLLVRLIFSKGGISDFYSLKKTLNQYNVNYEKIKKENIELKKTIHMIKHNSSYQKKLVRNHLGFIAKDEFLVVFPKRK